MLSISNPNNPPPNFPSPHKIPNTPNANPPTATSTPVPQSLSTLLPTLFPCLLEKLVLAAVVVLLLGPVSTVALAAPPSTLTVLLAVTALNKILVLVGSALVNGSTFPSMLLPVTTGTCVASVGTGVADVRL